MQPWNYLRMTIPQKALLIPIPITNGNLVRCFRPYKMCLALPSFEPVSRRTLSEQFATAAPHSPHSPQIKTDNRTLPILITI